MKIIDILNPVYDWDVELFIETFKSEDLVSNGWPCQKYRSDWVSLAKGLIIVID
jgi:hypothetical protein